MMNFNRVIYGLCGLLLLALAGFTITEYSYTSNSTIKDKVKKGEKAPNIKLPSPSGKKYSLKSLRGNLVLIDFWASWCRPCLAKLPKLKKLYKKFKDKEFEEAEGFTIFSVSLDKNKRAWKRCIKKYNLDWKYHVSDLKGWKAQPASKYGVRRIPFVFLVDADGTVLGRGMHLKDVNYELEQRLADN